MSENDLILKRAKTAELSHDYTLAIRSLTELLEQSPDDPALLAQLGSLYTKNGEYAKAEPCFLKIITQDPTDYAAIIQLGATYRRLGKYHEALNTLKEAEKLNDTDSQLYYEMGFTYKSMENYEEAINCFTNVTYKNPEDALAFNHLGVIYLLKKEYDKAIAAFQKGLRADANHPVLHLNLAKAYETLHAYDKAEQAFDTALRTRPGWTEAVQDYTKLLLNTNQAQKAENLTKQAIELDDTNAEMYRIQGECCAAQGCWIKAQQAYRKALELSPDSTASAVAAAQVDAQLGLNDSAYQLLSEFEQQHPIQPEYESGFADVLLSIGKYDHAKDYIQHILDRTPDNVPAQDLLAQYYICTGDNESAREQFKKIEAADRSYQQHYYSAANRCMQLKDADRAETYIRSYIDKKEDAADGRLMLAGILEQKGLPDDAMELYREVLHKDSTNEAARKAVRRLSEEEVLQEITDEATDDEFNDNAPELSMDIDDDSFTTAAPASKPAAGPAAVTAAPAGFSAAAAAPLGTPAPAAAAIPAATPAEKPALPLTSIISDETEPASDADLEALIEPPASGEDLDSLLPQDLPLDSPLDDTAVTITEEIITPDTDAPAAPAAAMGAPMTGAPAAAPMAAPAAMPAAPAPMAAPAPAPVYAPAPAAPEVPQPAPVEAPAPAVEPETEPADTPDGEPAGEPATDVPLVDILPDDLEPETELADAPADAPAEEPATDVPPVDITPDGLEPEAALAEEPAAEPETDVPLVDILPDDLEPETELTDAPDGEPAGEPEIDVPPVDILPDDLEPAEELSDVPEAAPEDGLLPQEPDTELSILPETILVTDPESAVIPAGAPAMDVPPVDILPDDFEPAGEPETDEVSVELPDIMLEISDDVPAEAELPAAELPPEIEPPVDTVPEIEPPAAEAPAAVPDDVSNTVPAPETEPDIPEEEPVSEEPETEPAQAPDKAQEVLGMFSALRAMLEFLPEQEKQVFLSGQERIQMDYVIASLEGRQGLLAAAETLRNAEGLAPEPQPEQTGTALLQEGLKILTGLSEGLSDQNLSTGLRNMAEGLAENLQ